MRNIQKVKLEMISHCYSFVKFAMVGMSTAAIFFLVMWLVDVVFKVNYQLAISLAYIFSTTFHFFMNRYFTFGAMAEKPNQQVFRYLIMWMINYLIIMMVVSVCVERFFLSTYTGVCVSTVFSVSVGYILARFWVFKNRG